MSFSNKKGYALTAQLATMGMLFALAMALSFIESTLPALPMLPQGVKLGLSNIVTMYCLFSMSGRDAFTLAVLKSGFVLLLRGPVGGLISLCGGLASVAAMLLLLRVPKLRLSTLTISIAGAVLHNVGQLTAAHLVVGSGFVFYYLPVMLISGIVMGVLTGMVLRLTYPYLERLKKQTATPQNAAQGPAKKG